MCVDNRVGSWLPWPASTERMLGWAGLVLVVLTLSPLSGDRRLMKLCANAKYLLLIVLSSVFSNPDIDYINIHNTWRNWLKNIVTLVHIKIFIYRDNIVLLVGPFSKYYCHYYCQFQNWRTLLSNHPYSDVSSAPISITPSRAPLLTPLKYLLHWMPAPSASNEYHRNVYHCKIMGYLLFLLHTRTTNGNYFVFCARLRVKEI